MKTKSELESIKRFVDNTYSRWGNVVSVTTDKPFDPRNPELGYCFKYKSEDGKVIIYKIICSSIGIDRTDFRVMMHEYGHVYLGHLDGIHEELDTQICNVFRDYRGELIEKINKECGIDFGDKLIERVIDDPYLNHSIHNIAMDMEVNSKILSKDDVEEMEMDITSVLPKDQEEFLKYLADNVKDEEDKKKLEDALNKMKNESKIKLIVPERYHLSDGSPFPKERSYSEYLMLIIKNLDQFVKMMVSIKNGGNGDTSNVTSKDVQDALNKSNSQSGNGNGDGDQSSGAGGDSGMKGLSDLMEEMGMTPSSSSGGDKDSGDGNDKDGDKDGDGKDGSSDKDGSGPRSESKYKGTRGDSDKDGGTSMKDHRTDSRDDADKKRELGQIKAGGGTGCGSSGGPGATRVVTKTSDDVDMALDEVINNFKHRVIKKSSRKDMMYLYNRGINRSVIAPTIRRKTTISNEPTIVFLIDISGSMETELVDRILNTISKNMKRIGRGLRYNIITWSTYLGEHIKDIDPRKGVPDISTGGGTRMAKGIQYFKDNYGPEAIMILISDFEDYLEEWKRVESTMPEYTMYGFNYGSSEYSNDCFKYLKVKNFKRKRYGY